MILPADIKILRTLEHYTDILARIFFKGMTMRFPY